LTIFKKAAPRITGGDDDDQTTISN
jgi:hypothetical protein